MGIITSGGRPIRILVVEDSPTARGLLVMLFRQCDDFEVVGTALDGIEAVRQAVDLRPDLITMDIQLPRQNGLEATRQIMQLAPAPIVVVTASLNQPDMDLTFEALRAGAVSVVKKPARNDEESCEQVIRIVRLMADVPVVHRFHADANPHVPIKAASSQPGKKPHACKPVEKSARRAARVVGIASSTGGPGALASALKVLPKDYPLPILVVQHITPGFAASLANWLDGELKLHVRLAVHGEMPQPGTVLIAPDNCHLQLGEKGQVVLLVQPPHRGQRPSADLLFSSLASVYKDQAVGVILTGMGDDGVEGLAELHQQGGVVLAQDEATCAVYGMPREAARRGLADYILPVNKVGAVLLDLAGKEA